MIPPTWMIEELERRRQEREELERPQLWIEVPAPEPVDPRASGTRHSREPIVIELW